MGGGLIRADDLQTIIVSFGTLPEGDCRATASSAEAWIEHASGRPEWACWGKARPSGACPAHPVLCHIVDVAAVAALLFTTHAPRALRQRLLGIVPGDERASLRLLLFVVALHDIGKYTPAFQAKVETFKPLLIALGFDLNAYDTARHHGAAGLEFACNALVEIGVEPAAALSLARAVTAHHGTFPKDENVTNRRLAGPERGRSPLWDRARASAVSSLRDLFGVGRAERVEVDHAYVMLLAGLTAVADWIGSMEEVFSYEPPQPSLASYWPLAQERAAAALERVGMRSFDDTPAHAFEALFPGYEPWPLHRAAATVAASLAEPTLVVVEAPMGEGKTEAALLLANAAAARLGQQGLFIGLPTKATANQMLGRVRAFLHRTRPDAPSNLVLAHGDADLVEGYRSLVAIYDRDDRKGSGVRAETWFLPKKRTLLADHAVGTIDQALLGVLRTPHAFVRLWGLAGKTVVLDEVHAYDAYTSAILDGLVRWLGALGTTVVLLSATLPSSRRAALVRSWRRGAGARDELAANDAQYPRVTVAARAAVTAEHVTPRGASVPVTVTRVDDNLDAIAEALARGTADGGCVGWICNTVDRAQQAYQAVQRAADGVETLLIHARMLPEERGRRETKLEHWLGPAQRGAQRPKRCVVVGTQVLEQSLDVDFDLLVTDLAPIDLLLQRAGRLHRHRDRKNRSPAHPSPHLWIVHPAGPPEDVPIRDVAVVYAEALVRGTLRVLEGRTTVTLPDDIEALVEAVYRAAPPPASDALFGKYIDHFGRACAQRQNAENRLLPNPTDPDDIFSALQMPFEDDDDPRVHEELRAVTRDAEESVQVVCLVARDGGVFVDEHDPTPLDLAVTPDRVLAARLARRTIGVSRPSAVRLLLADTSYLPDAWRESAVLRHRRVVMFTNGEALVGDTRMRLHPELGLILENPRTGSSA